MIKRPTIINMSLNALRDLAKTHESSAGDKLPENCAKNSQAREEMLM
jgi:hypothetical protein